MHEQRKTQFKHSTQKYRPTRVPGVRAKKAWAQSHYDLQFNQGMDKGLVYEEQIGQEEEWETKESEI